MGAIQSMEGLNRIKDRGRENYPFSAWLLPRDWGWHHQPPWSSGLPSWATLYHQISQVCSLQIANCGTSCLHNYVCQFLIIDEATCYISIVTIDYVLLEISTSPLSISLFPSASTATPISEVVWHQALPCSHPWRCLSNVASLPVFWTVIPVFFFKSSSCPSLDVMLLWDGETPGLVC